MRNIWFAATLVLGLAIAAQAAEKNTASIPAKRDDAWLARHEDFVGIAKKGGVDLVFLGDSITDGWRNTGQAVWEKNFAPLKAANFGISSDRTQHVLWRVQNGELNGIKPKVVVLMIGTNNLGGNTEDEIIKGIKAILQEIHTQAATTKVLLLGIFPRDASAKSPMRDTIKRINFRLRNLDDNGKTVKYLDIGTKFLDHNGTLPTAIMSDGVHPTAKGYEIWAEAILPTVTPMLK